MIRWEVLMKFSRRNFLHLAVGTAAVPTVSRFAWAQAYPARPVRIIVPYIAGASSDIIARLFAQWLSERLGQQFIVENRPGAGGNLGTEAVVSAPPDGYTLLFAATANAINATLYDKLKFNFIRDIAPVAGLVRLPNVVEVNPSLPVTTVAELIAYAKANPGKINMATGGVGVSGHMAGELFKAMTGVNMIHVPYRGSTPAITDLIGGQVHIMFEPPVASIEHIKAGRLRALAVTTAARSEALPDVPTVGEFVPGYEASTWYGVGVPKNTPIEVVDRLNAALSEPRMKARIADLGGTPLTGSPTDFGRHIAAETDKWGKVIRAANIKLD